jgi:hypothetical protein
MNPPQMAASLRQLAPVLEASSGAGQARVLVRVADGLDLAAKQTLSAIVKKVEKSAALTGPSATGTAASELLQTVSGVFKTTGAATQSKDFAVLAEMLRKLATFQGDDVYALLAAALAPPEKAVKQPKQAKGPEFDVLKAADDLTAATSNNDAFDALVAELSKQSKPTLTAIAARFLGFERSYKTKVDVLKAIRARQLQDAIQTSRERRIGKIAV